MGNVHKLDVGWGVKLYSNQTKARQSLTSGYSPSRLRPLISMHYMHYFSLRPTTRYFSSMPPRHLANIAETS